MPNDSTSARWPLYMLCGQCTGEGCDACAGNGYVPAAIPPSDETPEVSTGTMYRLDDGRMRAMAAHYTKLDADRAPLVDTGAPTAGGAWSDEYHTLDQAVMDAQALPRTDRHIAILTRIRDRFAPPSPEGTGTPPTPSELPSRTELGVGGAGELPGVSEYEGAQALTSVFAFAKRECYSDEEEIVDVAERYVAGLRLRAEAAERRVGTLETMLAEERARLVYDPACVSPEQALRDLDKLRAQIELRATLSSQRTL